MGDEAGLAGWRCHCYASLAMRPQEIDLRLRKVEMKHGRTGEEMRSSCVHIMLATVAFPTHLALFPSLVP